MRGKGLPTLERRCRGKFCSCVPVGAVGGRPRDFVPGLWNRFRPWVGSRPCPQRAERHTAAQRQPPSNPLAPALPGSIRMHRFPYSVRGTTGVRASVVPVLWFGCPPLDRLQMATVVGTRASSPSVGGDEGAQGLGREGSATLRTPLLAPDCVTPHPPSCRWSVRRTDPVPPVPPVSTLALRRLGTA